MSIRLNNLSRVMRKWQKGFQHRLFCLIHALPMESFVTAVPWSWNSSKAEARVSGSQDMVLWLICRDGPCLLGPLYFYIYSIMSLQIIPNIWTIGSITALCHFLAKESWGSSLTSLSLDFSHLLNGKNNYHIVLLRGLNEMVYVNHLSVCNS